MSEASDRRSPAVIAGQIVETCLTLLSSIATLSLAIYAIALITGRAW
jgi:hypothetical protein